MKKEQNVCGDDENFIQNKFGYCFYSVKQPIIIYNLFVHPKYRRKGVARKLIKYAIGEIRESGWLGEIEIEFIQSDKQIDKDTLIQFYNSMELKVI
jgi:GNAT superfamily N-acetyltransferase